MGGFAWVTLATNDSYSLGALVLAHSLRNVNTAHKLAVLITPGVSPPMKEQLSTVFDVVKVVDVLDSKDEAHLALLKRPELGVTFTKIHCWKLTEFEKCVFLDADTLVLRNCDELFEREELSAAPDVGWPDCFNTGVFVFKPSIETFDNLIKFSLENGSFDGGDQGLLNQFFGDWATKDISKHLPFVYNLTSVAVYSYLPAFKQYETQVRIVHFIGSEKPWMQQLDPQTRSVNSRSGSEHLTPMLQQWWNIFCDKVHPSMTSNLECDSGMRNNEIEACVNDTLTQPEPENSQPFTPYIDKDDSRQINLPYQPFDVRSSTGELLNVTYLEQRKQEMKEEEEEEKKEMEEKWEAIKEELKKEQEEGYQLLETPEEQKEAPCEMSESQLEDYTVVEEQQPPPPSPSPPQSPPQLPPRSPPQLPPQSPQLPPQSPPQSPPRYEPPEEQSPAEEPSPFNYETFFPDETCVQTYLQQNVMTYQPLDNHEKKWDHVHVPEPEPRLPRFLTIAEDDKRQSLNVNCREEPESNHSSQEVSDYNPSENADQTMRKAASSEDFHALETPPEPALKWKSMTNLECTPPANSVESVSFWKSHPYLNDSNRRYAVPKLKPILPKQSMSQEIVNDVRPKITQYTEFHMRYQCPDAVPCDTLGFIERHILEEVAQKVPNADAEKLKTLSYIFPLEAAGKTEKTNELPKSEDIWEETDYDLSSCQRQKGNQPLQNVTYKRRNSCFLPVLKPIRPSKNEEGQRKIRPSYKSSKERGTKAKIESRKAREMAKAELSIKPSNEPSSVEDILKKLISFSKDYQEYFTEHPNEQRKEKENLSAVFKNAYPARTKESPRIHYSKEFEEPVEIPTSPLVTGHSISTKEDTVIMEPVMNGQIEAPIKKTITTALGTIPKTLTGEIEHNGTTNLEDIQSEDDTGLMYGNGLEKLPRLPKGCESSRSETPEPTKLPLGTIETNGVDIPENNRSGTRSPVPTYASVVKRGGTPFRTDTATSKTALLKKKAAVEKTKPSRVERKEKELQYITNQRTQPPPPLPPSKEMDALTKNSNPFSVLREDSPMTLKPSKKKVKPGPSLPYRRPPPVRKSNQDRRVIESLATIDDAHVDNSGIAGAIAKLSIQPGGLPGTPGEVASSAQEDYVRRQNWEMGTMDYMGRDSFDNIWSKICETIDGKVTKDLNTDGASSIPSAELTAKDEVVSPEKRQGQPQESPETMIAQSEAVPPIESDANAGTGNVASEFTAAASDIASKATGALEAFGKLFVSGPVAIKSEVAEEAIEKKEEAQSEEADKKSTEQEEEGKQKKGVINKILELVGVGRPETSTAIFYDIEQPQGEQHKEDPGNSVFYDTETPPEAGEERKLSAQPAPGITKARSPSPSLTLKTTPETEVVSPSQPSTPMTPLPSKDDKMLTVDDTIKATPPVTDKKFDAVPKPADQETIKSEVDNIIETAKKIAEDQIQQPKEPQSPVTSTSMALVPRPNDALEVFGKIFVSGPVTIKSEVAEEPTHKPAIPMHDVPGRISEPATSVFRQPEEAAPQTTELEKPVSSESAEPAALAKPEETPAAQIAELAAAAVGAVAGVLAKLTDSTETAETPGAPQAEDSTAPMETPSPPQTTEPAAPQPVESASPRTPQVPEAPVTVEQATPQPTGSTTPASVAPASEPRKSQSTDSVTSVTAAPASPPKTPKPAEPTPEVLSTPSAEKPDDPKPESTLSKTNEALEAFGKHFVSGPVTLKSEVPETVTPEKSEIGKKDPEPSEGHSKASEALEAFGKVFVSGPVTLKSEVSEEVKSPGQAETDAVHRVFQPKPEEEPIYSNVDDVEEIKVTSEEDRRKEKPQSSKLTEQILKAIPAEMRKPFSEAASDVSAEVAQLLSAAEEQTTSILLDKPVGEEVGSAPEEGEGGPSVPPVPPRRNRSKGRDAPLPPPKKKGKNGKD